MRTRLSPAATLLGLKPVAWTERHYFSRRTMPRAIIPSATAKRRRRQQRSLERKRWRGLRQQRRELGRIGRGWRRYRLSPDHNRQQGYESKNQGDRGDDQSGGVWPYSDVSQKNRAAKSAITTMRKNTAAMRPKAAGIATRFTAV